MTDAEQDGAARSDFGSVLLDYWQSVIGYAQFLDLVGSALEDYPTKREALLSAELDRLLRSFAEVATPNEARELSDAMSRVLSATTYEGSNEVSTPQAPPPVTAPVSLTLSPRPGRVLMQLMRTLHYHASPEHHRDILHRGTLTGLVGQFEVLIADLTRRFFKRVPQAASVDKAISLTELLSFGSMDDAVEFVITERIDDLLRGSLDDWRKFFKSRMNIDVASMAPDWERFSEYVQRRHIIVHAGGRLSRRYMENVEKSLMLEYHAGAEVGSVVTLPRKYIVEALVAFEVTGLLLGLAAWLKVDKSDVDAVEAFVDTVIYQSMLAGRWTTVLHVSAWAADESSFGQSTRVTAQVNHWLALKRLGRWNECISDVTDFDCSALRPEYPIVRAALLEDIAEFARLVRHDSGASLDERAWDEWPVFDEIRSGVQFQELKKEFSPRRQFATDGDPEPNQNEVGLDATAINQNEEVDAGNE